MQEQVVELVGEMVLAKLHKTPVVEENILATSIYTQHGQSTADQAWERHTTTKTVPARVVRQVLKTLGRAGEIRKVGYDGRQYIVLARQGVNATHGVARAHGEAESSWIRSDARTRRARFGRDTELEYAHQMPLTDVDIHASERIDAYTAEGSTADSPLEAELPSWSASEPRVASSLNPGYDQRTQKRIDFQIRRGLGSVNAQRADRQAKRQWLETPEGQRWLALQEVKRTERAHFVDEFGVTWNNEAEAYEAYVGDEPGQPTIPTSPDEVSKLEDLELPIG